MTGDLFEKFHLTAISADVARVKPNGDKNALRKTYKGHIKTLGLSGHFDVVKKEQSELMELLVTPEEDWQNRGTSGTDIERGLSGTVQANLMKGMTMARGQIPKALWDNSVLGDLAPGPTSKKAKPDVPRATAPATPTMSAAGLALESNKPLMSHVDRARRLGTKRSYQDTSFEGYGGGYDDHTGYNSTGDGDDRSSKLKRRKQVHSVGSSVF